MAEKTELFPHKVDRTPFSACIWLAVFMIAILVIGATLIWNLAAYVKHQKPWSWHWSWNSSQDPYVQQVKEATAGDLEKKGQEILDQAQKTAKDKAVEEAHKQTQELKAQIKQDATDQINQYLPK